MTTSEAAKVLPLIILLFGSFSGLFWHAWGDHDGNGFVISLLVLLTIKSTHDHPALTFQRKNGRAANPSPCRDMTEAITIASQTFALIKYLLAFPPKNNGLEAKNICGMRQHHAAVFNLCNE